jgi:hypothetical protein
MVAHQCRGRDLLGGFYLVSPPVSDVELDVAVAPALAQQLADLADKKPDQLIFDITAVGFLDCAAAACCLPPPGRCCLAGIQ